MSSVSRGERSKIIHTEHLMEIGVVCAILSLYTGSAAGDQVFGEKAEGTRKYSDFERARACASCHVDFFQQWRQAMMSQAYTHHWDEIEYFDLAVVQADQVPKVAGVKAACNGCHSPMAFLAGDNPPPRVEKKSRANESVTCDVCHTIKGAGTDPPFNFSYISSPGKVKFGPRKGLKSPHHETRKLDFISTPEFCGNCHNEKSPYGIWVKSTQLEYREGPYPKMGLKCHDCHMPKAEGRVAVQSQKQTLAHQHLFYGAHVPAKTNGVIELRMHPDREEVEPGEPVKITLYLFNAKAGHKVPTGSVEDREMWVHVEAMDSKGKVYHLPVDRKGFEGEETTIATNEPAWFDLGRVKGIDNFKGIPRDGVPAGDRIFRMAYFNPRGEMTIMQWYTSKLGVDYRIGPLETKVETYTFKVPEQAPLGKFTVKAVLYYRLLIKPVGDFLNVPAEETAARVINSVTTEFSVVD